MILTRETLKNQGLKIDIGLTDNELDKVINDAELLVVVPMIGFHQYGQILGYSESDPRLVGGGYTKGDETFYIAGLHRAISYIAYAYLLLDDICASSFGSVRKKDDYSENVDAYEEARRHFASGIEHIRQLANIEGWNVNAVSTPFNEKAF